MPNKKVDNLKDPTMKKCGQQWQKALNVPNLTTKEWNYAASLKANGVGDKSIRKEILNDRKK